MKLKIFTLGWDKGGYGGGLCVVAANDAEEAILLAKEIGWYAGEYGATEIKNAYYEGKPCVLDSGYYQE